MKRRAWRRTASALALFGLAFRLLVVAVHVPPAAAAAGALPAAAGLFTQIIICTGSGLRVIQLDKNGKPVAPEKSPPPQSCPICTSLSAVHLALAPAVAVVPVPQPTASYRSEQRRALVVGYAPLIARSRDPPLQA